jgi:hypothetical protein
MFESFADHIVHLLTRVVEYLPFQFGIGGSTGRLRGPKGHGPVPDVRGLDVDEALMTLARDGFRFDVVRLEERPAPVMGTLVDQDPAPGIRRRRGHRVTIHVYHPRQASPDARS